MTVFLTLTSILSLAIVPHVWANPLGQKRSQCAAKLSDAEGHANALQSSYYDKSSGQYKGGELWTDANTLEDLGNLMLAAGSTTWSYFATDSYIAKAALDSNTNWASLLGGSNDDSQWVILSLWKMADYVGAHGGDTSPYLTSAKKIYELIEEQWDDTCKGGVWWSTAHTYKNAITNHLFLYTSADGYLRNKNETYLENAKKAWTWLSNSGMRNSQGLWNDGLTSSCQNNGQTTWTYNQAVVASGLSALSTATGDESYLTEAEVSLDAVLNHLTVGGILKESCDNAESGGTPCNNDQTSFKGIYTKHLQYYLDNASSRVSKYSSALGKQYSGVYSYATGPDYATGSVWYVANEGGSQFTPEAANSGLAAIIAAAKYGSC